VAETGCQGFETRVWGFITRVCWSKRVAVVQRRTKNKKEEKGGRKRIAGGQDTWLAELLGLIMHGWGSRMRGRDQKRVVEVKNACWEGLVTWWAVEGLEQVVGGVKVVVVVVVGCIVVLLVAISVVDT
jgi:hypothetical protein